MLSGELSCITDLCLTLLHSERPKLCTILAFLSAVGLNLFVGIKNRKFSYFTCVFATNSPTEIGLNHNLFPLHFLFKVYIIMSVLFCFSCVPYVPDPENMTLLKTAVELYRKFNLFPQALRFAMQLNDSKLIEEIFLSCKDM